MFKTSCKVCGRLWNSNKKRIVRAIKASGCPICNGEEV